MLQAPVKTGTNKSTADINCPTCNDTGRVEQPYRESPLLFGATDPCPDCNLAEMHIKRCQEANIPKRFWMASLDGYTAHTSAQEEALEMVRRYSSNLPYCLQEGRGLTLWGPVGTGKTHLAVTIILAAKAMNLSALFITEDGIFDKFKAEWGDPAEEMKFLLMIQRVRFLVIDDMGIRRPSDYVSDRYEAILNTRYASGIPTIITTNKSPDQLKEVYERQMSRLAGNVDLHIVGPDGRE